MRAMILAAGRGERMRPLTDELPKPLLDVGGKPLIQYHIERLVEAGIHDVVINHAWLGEKLVAALGDGSKFNCKIQWSAETQALETAGGMAQALPLLTAEETAAETNRQTNKQLGEEEFILVNGDVWTDYDFLQLTQHALGNDLARLILVENPEQHPAGDFCLKDLRISLPDAEAILPTFTYAGIARVHPELVNNLPSARHPLKPLLDQAIADGRLAGEYYGGEWMDIGTVARLQALRESLKESLKKPL